MYPINLGKKSIGKNTPDKKSIGKVTKFAKAGALSSLGAKLEIANPIDKNSTPPKSDNSNMFIVWIAMMVSAAVTGVFTYLREE